MRRFPVTIVAAEKLNCYIFWVSVVLVIRLTKRIGRIILLSVAGPTLPYFSTLSHNRHDSQEKKS